MRVVGDAVVVVGAFGDELHIVAVEIVDALDAGKDSGQGRVQRFYFAGGKIGARVAFDGGMVRGGKLADHKRLAGGVGIVNRGKQVAGMLIFGGRGSAVVVVSDAVHIHAHPIGCVVAGVILVIIVVGQAVRTPHEGDIGGPLVHDFINEAVFEAVFAGVFLINRPRSVHFGSEPQEDFGARLLHVVGELAQISVVAHFAESVVGFQRDMDDFALRSKPFDPIERQPPPVSEIEKIGGVLPRRDIFVFRALEMLRVILVTDGVIEAAVEVNKRAEITADRRFEPRMGVPTRRFLRGEAAGQIEYRLRMPDWAFGANDGKRTEQRNQSKQSKRNAPHKTPEQQNRSPCAYEGGISLGLSSTGTGIVPRRVRFVLRDFAARAMTAGVFGA